MNSSVIKKKKFKNKKLSKVYFILMINEMSAKGETISMIPSYTLQRPCKINGPDPMTLIFLHFPLDRKPERARHFEKFLMRFPLLTEKFKILDFGITLKFFLIVNHFCYLF